MVKYVVLFMVKEMLSIKTHTGAVMWSNTGHTSGQIVKEREEEGGGEGREEEGWNQN